MAASRSDRDAGHLSDAVRSLAAPVAETLGAELLDVQVTGQSGRRVVRLTADAADLDAAAGLDVDTIATLSRRVGRVLEDADLIAGAYTLEVTSPGADRPLTTARDFTRNLGREVRLHRNDELEDTPELVGTLEAATDDEVTLDVAGERVTVALAEIDHGRVVLPW
jgi:ribosome maturation factor RimP